MNSDLYFDGKKYISSSRAAKISGYVNDYIGQLCRDGKLECRMIGRSWYVSFDSLIAHKNGNAGNSKKAQKVSKILSVDQNKKEEASPVNFEPQILHTPGATTDEKVSAPISVNQPELKKEEVIKNVPAQNEEKLPLFAFDLEVASSEEKKEIVSPIASTSTLDEGDEHRIPIYTNTADTKPVPIVVQEHAVVSEYFANPTFTTPILSTTTTLQFQPTHHGVFGKKFPMVALGMVSILISFLGFRFMTGLETQSSYVARNNVVELSSLHIDLTASVLTGAVSMVNGISETIYLSVNDWTLRSHRTIVALLHRNESPLPLYTDDPPLIASESGPSQGMVVVPVTAKTDKEATIAKIKNTFSDEVSVEPSVDGSDGVIRPVFKKSKGDDYLYVLVPINN